MSELTPAEALGRGLDFASLWDFDVSAGSIGTIDGYDLLGRDLAFGTIQELEEHRGDRLTANLAEEVKIALRRVARRDGRVSRVVPPIEVSESDDAETAEVAVTLVANTGERGEYVLQL